MAGQTEINQQEVIQNLVNKVALKEYQLSQYEVLNQQLQNKIKDLEKDKEFNKESIGDE